MLSVLKAVWRSSTLTILQGLGLLGAMFCKDLTKEFFILRVV